MKSKEKKETMKIGIIGAGYSGLSIAKELEKNGQEVTLFEKNRYVGGMVDTVSIYETRLEKYYRHIFKSDKEAISLIEEMGLKNELIWPATKMGYLSNRKIYEFGTPISLLKFKELNFIQKLRFGFNVIHIKLINDYKKTAESWLKSRIGEKVYSKIWEPLLLSKFGEKKSQVSMAWLWGKIKLRSTSSTKDGEQLGYIEGSYQKLTDNFYKYLIDRKVKINLNAKITNVEKENGKYAVKYEENGAEKEEKTPRLVDCRGRGRCPDHSRNPHLPGQSQEQCGCAPAAERSLWPQGTGHDRICADGSRRRDAANGCAPVPHAGRRKHDSLHRGKRRPAILL